MLCLWAPLPASGEELRQVPEFTWSAPASCPQATEVVEHVERILGQPLTTPRPQAIRLSAVVTERVGAGYEVRIVAWTAQGQSDRILAHEDCAKLAEATAFVTAFAIDPEGFEERGRAASGLQGTHQDWSLAAPKAAPLQPAPLPAVGRSSPSGASAHTNRVILGEPTGRAAMPPAGGPRAQRTSAERVRLAGTRGRRSLPWALGVGAEGLIGAGLLPRVGTGLGAAVGATVLEHWRLFAVGRYWFAQRFPVEDFREAEIETRLLSVGGRLCAWPHGARWGVLGCAGWDLGDIRSRASGQDFQTGPSSGWQHGRWSGSVLGVGAEFRATPRVSAGAHAEGGVAWERPRIGAGVDGRWQQEWQPSLLYGALGLALRVEIVGD